MTRPAKKLSRRRSLAAILLATAAGQLIPARAVDDLQAVLDRGEALLLEPRTVYEVKATLRVTHPGQRITTRDARRIDDFATLRLVADAEGTLLDATGISGTTIERVIVDGNRYGMLTPDGKAPPEPLLSMGQEGGDHQVVRQCVILNARTAGGWGSIHFHEQGRDNTIEDNVIFGAGVDVLGNGRSGLEQPFGYGDGISTASRNTLVRNNLVIDATDEGIMVQGAPGTRVESNVVAAVSREMLGGIALIDPSAHYVLGGAARRHDYRGVVVRHNLVDARGARVHIGLAMGAPCWGRAGLGTTLVGACVESNLVRGGAAAYGYAACGIDDFVVRGNRSEAGYSGIGDGMPGNPPDPPGAFLFDPATVGDSRLQADFQPARRHLVHLMRNWWQPSSPLGYRATSYGTDEVEAVVGMAHLEMLGRLPSGEETERWTAWLNRSQANADTLRRALMSSDAFSARHGYQDPLNLQTFRTRLWMQRFAAESRKCASTEGDWPRARALYEAVLMSLGD